MNTVVEAEHVYAEFGMRRLQVDIHFLYRAHAPSTRATVVSMAACGCSAQARDLPVRWDMDIQNQTDNGGTMMTLPEFSWLPILPDMAGEK